MIDYWFPTGIYKSKYQYHDIIKSKVLKRVSERPRPINLPEPRGWPYWQKMHRSLIDPFQLVDSELLDFKYWIEQETNNFSKSFNSESIYRIDQSWINVYEKGDFQETHYHLGFDFSAVYFVSSPENSGRLIFESPLLPINMRPIKTQIETELNSTSVSYEPLEGYLLIFRSNLRHGVLPHYNKEPRISIAVNLIEKN